MNWVAKCYGSYWSPTRELCINPLNFALNNRPYDPTDSTQHRFGKSLFYEQRFVGKAIYPFKFELSADDEANIRTADTTKYTPFDVILKND